MNNLYINEEWYLSQDVPVYDNKIDEINRVLIWKPIWFKQVKYKVNKDWLFEEVKD